MGREHLRLVSELPDAELAGVVILTNRRQNQAGDQFGVRSWSEMERFCTEADLDAVHLCTPSGLHAQQESLPQHAEFISLVKSRSISTFPMWTL